MPDGIFPVYRCRCHGCGRTFIWTAKESPDELPPSYHSKGCQKRKARRLAEQMPTKCPRPDKLVYRDHKHAMENARDELVQPYRCVCGGIHLGHRRHTVLRYEIRGMAST